ncbi:MAG TPA: DUF6691 family protein [Paracoccaceae bacterium]|nr:DUF6691 family protein [Paracoccaceae bacterium]
MRKIVAFLAGLVFGLGLLISDMANPARVLAFLDVAAIAEGTWDPTLAFVMGGAMAVSALAWLIAYRRSAPVFGGSLPGAPRQSVDARLLGGSAIFGAGWGLAGICPGPALTAAGLGGAPMLLFIGAMLVGMVIYNRVDRMLTAAPA